ncbi:MAG: helix-turn-helix domain-containing protein [Clostridia bacterium]|nr:helix-turn-helix domain-containing protein [Clostridia bacterium]
MNQYVTGSVIRELRENRHMTQAELAEKLMVSDKTISKWETGKGYPDITLLEPIATALGVSLTELISGRKISNINVSANMMRSNLYVCPVCGNVIHSIGEAVISCHGIQLMPEESQKADENHMVNIEQIEDDFFVTINHEMSKSHYISFMAAYSFDGVQIIKLYPEGSAECRFKARGTRRIFFYCNKDGLYYVDVNRRR